MQPRPVNREMNNEFSVLGLPFQAVLLVLGVVGIFVIAAGIVTGIFVGTGFFFYLRRLISQDQAFIDWLVATVGQKRSYGPRRSF